MQMVRMRSLINAIFRLDTIIQNHFIKYEMLLVLTVYENGLVLVKMPQNI